MVFQGTELNAAESFVLADLGKPKKWSIDITEKQGVSHVIMELKLTLTGTGALTLLKMAPFSVISSMKVTDQDGKQLINLNNYHLYLLAALMSHVSPSKTILYDDGTNGWTEISAVTDVASTEEIGGTLHLPIRIGKSQKVTKLNFECNLNSLNSTTGITHVGDFATAMSDVAGSVRFSPVYDNAIVETFVSHFFNKETVSTSVQQFDSPPEGARIRYAMVVLPDFWQAQVETTDNENLIDEFAFKKDNQTTPIKVNFWTGRHMLADLIDLDPEFDTIISTIKAWNWLVIVLPDSAMGKNARFTLKNLTSQDAELILIEVKPDPAKQQESKKFSPAVFKRFLGG